MIFDEFLDKSPGFLEEDIMANEIPTQGQPDRSGIMRDIQRESLEKLPEPVRALYERASKLVTKAEPGFDIYSVDTVRFKQILAEKGLEPVVEGDMGSEGVFVGGEDPEFPILVWFVSRDSEMIPNPLVKLSTRGLKVSLYRDEESGQLVIGKGKEGLPQDSETALLFAEALLDSIEGQESERHDTPKRGVGTPPLITTHTLSPMEVQMAATLFDLSRGFDFWTPASAPDVGFSGMTDEERQKPADRIGDIVGKLGTDNPAEKTPGTCILIGPATRMVRGDESGESKPN